MRDSTILIEGFPKGKFLTGIISGALLPGVKMQIQHTAKTTGTIGSTALVGGKFTWEVYTPSADNDPRLVSILLEDEEQGKALNAAYVSGTWCRMYAPLPGEEMNVLLLGQAGTASANAFFVGERLGAIQGSGKFQPVNVSVTYADFVCCEHLDEVPDVDTLVWAMRQ